MCVCRTECQVPLRTCTTLVGMVWCSPFKSLKHTLTGICNAVPLHIGFIHTNFNFCIICQIMICIIISRNVVGYVISFQMTITWFCSFPIKPFFMLVWENGSGKPGQKGYVCSRLWDTHVFSKLFEETFIGERCLNMLGRVDAIS